MLTVGELAKLAAGLPADMPVFIYMHEDEWGDQPRRHAALAHLFRRLVLRTGAVPLPLSALCAYNESHVPPTANATKSALEHKLARSIGLSSN